MFDHSGIMDKIFLFFLLACVAVASCRPAEDDKQGLSELTKSQREEAASAQYHFASDIQDGISDLSQQREESRDGLAVTGFYSYSDGHFKRKVSYIADENGYRVTSEEVEPLEGPQKNPEGSASVHTVAHGNEVNYEVIGDDVTRHKTHLSKA